MKIIFTYTMKPEIKLHDKTFVPCIPYTSLCAAIDAVADKINTDFCGCSKPPVLLCILNGSIMFSAELMKRLNFNCELACLKVASYEGTHSTGTIRRVTDFTGSVKGKDVIIVEDIIDSGNTIESLIDIVKNEGANSIRICTMLFKPSAYKKDIHIDYTAMSIPNDFIVGFGLDYNELGRNYKDIYVLKEEK